MTDDQPAAGVALKPCPFCGFADLVVLEVDHLTEADGKEMVTAAVVCRKCGARGRRVEDERSVAVAKASHNWNTRAPTDAGGAVSVAIKALNTIRETASHIGDDFANQAALNGIADTAEEAAEALRAALTPAPQAEGKEVFDGPDGALFHRLKGREGDPDAVEAAHRMSELEAEIEEAARIVEQQSPDPNAEWALGRSLNDLFAAKEEPAPQAEVDCFECAAPLVGPFCPECNPAIKQALGYAVEAPQPLQQGGEVTREQVARCIIGPRNPTQGGQWSLDELRQIRWDRATQSDRLDALWSADAILALFASRQKDQPHEG